MTGISASSTTSSRLLYQQIASLLVYQGVFDDPIGRSFLALLASLYSNQTSKVSRVSTAAIQCLQCYGRWFQELAIADVSWQDWLSARILQDDNAFSQQAQKKPPVQIAEALQHGVRHDLSVLEQVYQCSPAILSRWVTAATQVATDLIPWERDNQATHFLHQGQHWPDYLEQLAGYYHRHGAGMFARYYAFRWAEGTLTEIIEPDWLPLADIVGYSQPKAELVRNTACLLASQPALNVLLYGSRGSGKSSMVKALLGEYHGQGLRLIEVDKTGLRDLPAIVELLRQQPQKFIIFIDDLSFEEDDEVFKSLKVVLEGGVRAKATNVVVYATSNRRHLVREFFDERPRPSQADEIHQWDTVQEKLSFSDRFGLTLTFEPATQDTYLQIVHHLAQVAHLTIDADTLDFRAKQWATRHNGRSGRTARQFIDFLIGEQALSAL